jgi:hypothetical protein
MMSNLYSSMISPKRDVRRWMRNRCIQTKLGARQLELRLVGPEELPLIVHEATIFSVVNASDRDRRAIVYRFVGIENDHHQLQNESAAVKGIGTEQTHLALIFVGFQVERFRLRFLDERGRTRKEGQGCSQR